MDNKITKEQIFKVAERYGLEAYDSQKPGLYINNEEMKMDDLFADVFAQLNVEEKIENAINVTYEKEKSRIKFKHITSDFSVNESEVA